MEQETGREFYTKLVNAHYRERAATYKNKEGDLCLKPVFVDNRQGTLGLLPKIADVWV